MFESALVGLGVGAVIALYRFALSNSEHIMRVITGTLREYGPLFLVWFVALAALCIAVGKLMRIEPYTQGSGIPQMTAEVAGKIDMPSLRVMLIKIVACIMCTFAGLSLGREGPSVLLGGLVGKSVSQVMRTSRQHKSLLVTCGAAAGMSAAFHAPFTGVLFAIEEIHRRFSANLIITVMISSVCADLLCSHIIGQDPIIHFVSFSHIPHSHYAAIIVMGVFCGVAGYLHNAGMFILQERVFDRIVQHAPYLRLAIPFALCGVVAYFVPDLLCGGDAIIEHILRPDTTTFATLALLLLGKYLLTAICFGSGAPGGTLLPLVVMGSLLGALFGMMAMRLAGVPFAYENAFVVLGIAGLFSSVVQSPVTAVVLVFELTGNLEALLATTLVSIISFVTASILDTHPFYEHLSARLLGEIESGGNTAGREGEMIVHTFDVSPGAVIESKLVSEVSWPADMIVITIRRADKESVVNGQTRIEALDKIAVLMKEDGEDDIVREVEKMCVPHREE